MYMLDSKNSITLMCLEAFTGRVHLRKENREGLDAGLIRGEFESKFLVLNSL